MTLRFSIAVEVGEMADRHCTVWVFLVGEGYNKQNGCLPYYPFTAATCPWCAELRRT